MVTVSLGNKKRTFRSMKEAAEAAGIPYITFYMRYRYKGTKAATAMRKPVRAYVKQRKAS